MRARLQVDAERYHDFSCGHRVVGHESKCALLHGHNYRVYFTIEPIKDLDKVGRVLDFSVIKSLLCEWLETYWDHRFLAYERDPLLRRVTIAPQTYENLDKLLADQIKGSADEAMRLFGESIVWVPFNPTAENMALHLLEVVGPMQLAGSGALLTAVRVEETRKCSATASWVTT